MNNRQPCRAFCVGGHCFRYAPKRGNDNLKIAGLILPVHKRATVGDLACVSCFRAIFQDAPGTITVHTGTIYRNTDHLDPDIYRNMGGVHRSGGLCCIGSGSLCCVSRFSTLCGL